MIAVTNLSKMYGGRTLFEQASFTLTVGNRYGIVGANGSGKSTLLRILTGEEDPSDGEVNVPKRARIGILRQDHFQYEHTPIVEVVMMGHEALWAAMQEKEAVLARAHEHFDADRYAELEDIVMQHDGYALESRAAEILEGLGIPAEKHREPLSILSGGFKLRVLLAQALASSPDALLLDEPTNHLDIVSIAWLEQFLGGFKGCVVVVSHDHQFLDRVCSHIIDVDYARATLYTGNYTSFEQQKVDLRDRLEGEIAKREKEIDDHKRFIERFRAKATKARQAQSRVKQMEKITIDRLPESSRRHPKFKFQQARQSGRVALELLGISKAYGEQQVLDDVSLTVRRGDRIAVIGPNGVGKSTLLRIAMGEIEADDGLVEWGHEARPGYFAQDHHNLRSGDRETVLSWLWDRDPTAVVGKIRGKLAEVLFSKDDVDKRVSALSGGEQARLIFAWLGIMEPSVLVLDEPTNHLDLEGIEALAEALKAYDGTLIFVSHDRWFVSKLATRVFEIRPDGAEDYDGSYEEFLEWVERGGRDADHLQR
jgi:ATPase subunit of ABC transporter with duplicated ATPase domains